MKPKILFLNPAVSPYRVGFYDELRRLCDIKFLFYFSNARDYRTHPIMELWNYEILKGEYEIPGYGRGFTPSLVRKLFTEDYDIVVNSDPCSFAAHVAYPIAKLRKKKFVTWAELWRYPNYWTANIIKPYVQHIVKNSDLCIAAGTKAYELFKSFGANKIVIAPNASFDVKTLPKHKVDLPKKYILHVGDIREQKGIHNIIAAFEEVRKTHKDIHLVLVGAYKELHYSDTLLTSVFHNKHIHFLNRIPWNKLRPYYEKCLMYVLGAIPIKGIDPVQSWEMSLNEAMSASKPVIATDVVGGAYDLIHESMNGYMVQADDVGQLTRAIEDVLNGKPKKMGKYSRKLIDETYNHENMAQRFAEAINDL